METRRGRFRVQKQSMALDDIDEKSKNAKKEERD